MFRPSCLIIFFIYQVRSSEKGEAKNHQRRGAFCCCAKYQNTTTTKVFTNLTYKPGNGKMSLFLDDQCRLCIALHCRGPSIKEKDHLASTPWTYFRVDPGKEIQEPEKISFSGTGCFEKLKPNLGGLAIFHTSSVCEGVWKIAKPPKLGFSSSK